jgi:quinohemoprotein amine dehydrogenase
MVCRTKGFILCSLLPAFACLSFWTPPASTQEGSPAPKVGTAKEAAEKGYPIKNELVVAKCGTCHLQDAKGNLGRISYVRTTPEGWEESIKRMVRLNGLQIAPEEARQVLRYLADNHGLAPEEAAKIQYFNERRIQDETILPKDNEDVQHACASCHAFAKPLSWRRTPKDWDYLKAMHQAFFPSIDPSFSRLGRRPAEGEHKPEPVDVALEFIKKAAPLETAEWANWQGSVHTPKLAGKWFVSGSQPGKGKFFGEMTIAAGDGGIFTTKTDLTYANGQKYVESGSSIVYTGYAWRGHSKPATVGTEVDAPNNVREVMMLSRDENELKGRWFWGVYQEFGMEVTMHRAAASGGALLGTDAWSLKTGSTDKTLRIFGSELPQNVTVADVDLGAGVTVSKVDSSTTDMLTVTASVDKAAIPGKRLITVKGMTLPDAFVVYDHIDFLKVLPETELARLGSEPHAKGYAQCEAIAYGNGADGKPNTEDDIVIGPVPASWKLEEFVASYGDDDIDFVGKMDEKTGLFTPSSDGPNPKRKSMRNNYGDVWAVATYKPEGEEKPLIGRAYLIVAVPEYQQWDQPEVGQ